jgi:HSP20 family protein
MAQDTSTNQQQGNTQQGSSRNTGQSSNQSNQSASDKTHSDTNRTETTRSDRQRSIATGRESNQSSGVTRGQSNASVRNLSADRMAPFSLMRRMSEDMDRLFESFGFGSSGLGLLPSPALGIGRDMWRDASALDQSIWSPQVETFRRGDKIIVRADLPGLKKDDVKVEIDDGVLTLSGERQDEHEESRDDYYRSERHYGQFYRAIPLPDGVDESHCDATFKDGVLEVALAAPKQQERKAKQIPVK